MTSESTIQPITNTSAITLHMAKSQSILANERTILSYIRTSITIFVSGISFIRVFDYLALEVDQLDFYRCGGVCRDSFAYDNHFTEEGFNCLT